MQEKWPAPAVGQEYRTDGPIAATALEHKLTVVTRNVADFQRSGVNTLNPFA